MKLREKNTRQKDARNPEKENGEELVFTRTRNTHCEQEKEAMVAKADAIADPRTMMIKLHHTTTLHAYRIGRPVAEATVLRSWREIQTTLPAYSTTANMTVKQNRTRNACVGRKKSALATRGCQVWP